MIRPGKTTLDRMQDAAHNEATRIEIIEDGWVAVGKLSAPRLCRVRLRDDFAGIVRLIDIIKSDDVLHDRLDAALKRAAARVEDPSAVLAATDEERADQ